MPWLSAIDDDRIVVTLTLHEAALYDPAAHGRGENGVPFF